MALDKSKIFIALAIVALAGVAQAQIFATNFAKPDLTTTNYPALGFTPTNPPAAVPPTHDQPVTNDGICPLIEFDDVPITMAIEHLARQANVNYLVDPALMQKWTGFLEPIVRFKLRNVTAKDVLQRMLAIRGLALIEDPASNIAFIVPANNVSNFIFASQPAGPINADSHPTEVIPLIQFSDVPLTTAIEHLARQAGVNYMLNPNVCALWTGSGANCAEPQLSIRLEDVTAWHTLDCLLKIHGLVLIENPYTQIAMIALRGTPSPQVNARLLDEGMNSPDSSTNEIIPLIQFSDVPLDYALAHLIVQSGLNIQIDPRLVSDGEARKFLATNGIPTAGDPAHPRPVTPWFDPMPELSLRWENMSAKQAMVALCENYDLVIVKDDAAGILEIKPRVTMRRHQSQSK